MKRSVGIRGAIWGGGCSSGRDITTWSARSACRRVWKCAFAGVSWITVRSSRPRSPRNGCAPEPPNGVHWEAKEARERLPLGDFGLRFPRRRDNLVAGGIGHRELPFPTCQWSVLFAATLMSALSHAGSDQIVDLDETGAWGAYLDLSYPANFNSGEPHPWRSKLTTNRLSQFSPNMGMIYYRRETSEASPIGLEIGAQGGYDTDGQVPAASQLTGADVLRYLSRANVSYRAPIGNGLLLTGGLMSSFIGYESFYAKGNPNYTRSWIADYSPFFLIGAGGQYRISDRLDASLFIVSDFDYLAHHNNHPKYAGQISWRISPGWKLTQNLFAGPEQTDTAVRYWRFFSDSILQWTNDGHAIGLAYDVGTQQSAIPAASVQHFWTGAALFTRWQIQGPWALAVRPELYWDPNGTLTGSIQFIRALTATVEYAIVADGWKTQLRAEYRYDNSTGQQGGFYGAGGTDGPLVSGQSTILLAVLISFDRP